MPEQREQQRTARARTPGTQGAAKRERREQPEQRELQEHQEHERQDQEEQSEGGRSRPDRQHTKPVLSLMPLLARCSGSPGGWSWERLFNIVYDAVSSLRITLSRNCLIGCFYLV